MPKDYPDVYHTCIQLIAHQQQALGSIKRANAALQDSDLTAQKAQTRLRLVEDN